MIPVIGASIATAQDSIEHARALQRTQEAEDGLTEIAGLTEMAIDLEALAVTAGVVVGLRESGDAAGVRAALEAASRGIGDFGQRLNAAVEGEQEEAALLEARAKQAREAAFWLLVASGVGAASLALLASGLVARSILKPLAALETNAIRVAEGDLESRAETAGLDELASLGGSFNRMADSLIGGLRQQEQVNDQLRESEEWLQLAQVAGGIGIFDLDVPGTPRDAPTSTTASSAWSRAQLLAPWKIASRASIPRIASGSKRRSPALCGTGLPTIRNSAPSGRTAASTGSPARRASFSPRAASRSA